MNLINSAFYEDLADIVILNMNDLNRVLASFLLFKESCKIYCKTDFIVGLFIHLITCKIPHILITHHSDYPINNHRYSQKPACIQKWFAINVEYKSDDLIPIPLGTKTPEGREYHESKYKIKWLDFHKDRLKNKEKITDVAYCNWAVTNKSRAKITEKLEGNIRYKLSSGLSFEDYIEELSSYKYIISPEGNGIDNHRTWEALYVGSIPIVTEHLIYDSWKNIPIIQCKDYSDVNIEFLEKKLNNSYSFNELSTKYWESYINNEFLKIQKYAN